MIKKSKYNNEFNTPPLQKSLSIELKQVLMQRNLLTAKSRTKVCNMLDSLNDDDEQNKLMSLRSQAINEILTSEKSYLMQLEKLINYFVLPLKNDNIINLNYHTMLFGQIELIYNLNQELLNELDTNPLNIANAFLKIAPFLKLYSVYAFDYNSALITLQNLTDRNIEFRKFLERTETLPIVQCKLNALLITPIQRVPRYRLLLQQVLLYTSPSETNYKILQKSIKEIENTVQHINSAIEDQDTTQKMINLQNSLVNRLPHIVRPSRKIIKEGILNKMSSSGATLKRYCILMSDIFIYCKIHKDRNAYTQVINSLQCCCIFPLKKCKVSEIFPGNFKLTCQGDGIIFCSENINIAQNWITALREAIEIHIQCRKTIRKGSSKRRPIRKKDLNKFEQNENFHGPVKKKYSYSESESDGTSSKLNCFNLRSSSNVFKRKLNVNYFNTDDDDDDNSLKKLSKPKHMKMSHTNYEDPTYGFADYLKRTNNDNNNNYYLSGDDGGNDNDDDKSQQQPDILYPLRVNNDFKIQNNIMDATEFDNIKSLSKKRVTFDNDEILNEYNNSDCIINSNNNNNNNNNNNDEKKIAVTFGEKIVQFFSNLFY